MNKIAHQPAVTGAGPGVSRAGAIEAALQRRFDPAAGLLDNVLKPIAFTEQAAAIGDMDVQVLTRSDPDYRNVIAKGRTYLGTDYMRATHLRTQLRARLVELFRGVDALVTSTVAVTAFAAGTIGVNSIDGRGVDPHLGWSPFSWPINLTGLPAASVPCGFDAAGLPIGLQIVAPWLSEAAILRTAAASRRPRLGPARGRRSRRRDPD